MTVVITCSADCEHKNEEGKCSLPEITIDESYECAQFSAE